MRKLTKKALSLILCLLLVVSAFSGAISISAADTINPAPLNLDFADGLDHWEGVGTEAAPTVVVENGALKATDNYTKLHEVKTEKFNVPNAVGGETVRFSFNVKFDDTPIIDHAKYDAIVSGTEYILQVHLKRYEAGNTTAVETKTKTVYFKDGGPVISGSLTVVNPTDSFRIIITSSADAKKTWEITDVAFLVRDDSETAWTHAAFSSHGGSGFSYFAYTDGAVPTAKASADGSIGGTEAEGLTYKMLIASSASPAELLATQAVPQNLDFSKGLKYWGSTLSQNKGAVKGTNTASEVESVANGVVTLKQKTRNEQGIITQKFKVEGLKSGDKIRVVMVYKTVESETATVNDAYVKIRAYKTANAQRGGLPYGFAKTDDVTNITGTSAHNASTSDIKLPMDATGYSALSRSIAIDDTYENGIGVFDVMVGYGITAPKVTDEETGEEVTDYSTIAQLQIKQVYIFKETTDDADYYTYLPTAEKYKKKYLMPDGGTEENGIPARNLGNMHPTYLNSQSGNLSDYFCNITNYGVNEGLLNGDFSKGFKHWSVYRFYSDKRTSWSDLSKTILDSANLSNIASVDKEAGIVTINSREFYDDGVTAFTGDGLGLMSQPFTLSGLAEGDRLILALDGAGASTFNAGIIEVSSTKRSDNYGWNIVARKSAETDVKNMPYELWITPELTVTNPNNYFMVYIRNKTPAKTASFGNVRIFKVTDDNDLIDITDGYDAETDTVVNANGGTAEDGMLVARDASKVYYDTIPTTTDILNGDFADGLKYWRTGLLHYSDKQVAPRLGTPSHFTEIVDGAAVITGYFDNKSTNSQASIRTPLLNLDAVAGKNVTFSVNILKVTSGGGVRVRVFEDGVQVFRSSTIYDKGIFKTDEITVKQGSKYELEIGNNNDVTKNGKCTITIDDVAILVKDGGGLENAPMIKIDGSLYADQFYGDANFDSKVDILDLVRLKKAIAGDENGIFFAASDIVKDDNIDASDLIEIVNIVLGKNK